MQGAVGAAASGRSQWKLQLRGCVRSGNGRLPCTRGVLLASGNLCGVNQEAWCYIVVSTLWRAVWRKHSVILGSGMTGGVHQAWWVRHKNALQECRKSAGHPLSFKGPFCKGCPIHTAGACGLEECPARVSRNTVLQDCPCKSAVHGSSAGLAGIS